MFAEYIQAKAIHHLNQLKIVVNISFFKDSQHLIVAWSMQCKLDIVFIQEDLKQSTIEFTDSFNYRWEIETFIGNGMARYSILNNFS